MCTTKDSNKMSDLRRNTIIAFLKTGKYSYNQIADIFKVSKTTISKLKRGLEING